MENSLEQFMKKFRELEMEYGHGSFSESDLEDGFLAFNFILNFTANFGGVDYRHGARPLDELPDEYRNAMSLTMACFHLLKKLNNQEGTDSVNPAKSLFFAYAVYWHLGEDPALGKVCRNELKSLNNPPAPAKDEWGGYEIWREISSLWNYYLSPSFIDKPPFRKELAFG